jgi:hypothetical protein
MTGRFVLSALAVAGGFATWQYIQKMKRMQRNLQYIPTVQVLSISTKGITLLINILFKNPSAGSFSIQNPFIKLDYKGTVIGSTDAKNKHLTIPAYGEAVADNILLVIPVYQLFTVTAEVVKNLLVKKPVELTLTVITDIQLGKLIIPYEEKKPIIIRAPS